MNKTDKRSVMNTLGQINVSDEQALSFIKNLAQNEMFKSPRAFEAFCVDCAIFYTASMFVMSEKIKQGMGGKDISQWEDSFIEKVSYFEIL